MGNIKKSLMLILVAGVLAGAIDEGMVSAQIRTDMNVNGPSTQIRVDLTGGSTEAPVKLTVIHLVKPGDTLWSISRKYGASLNELVRVNKLDTRKSLLVNQRIVIPVQSKVQKSVPQQTSDVQKLVNIYVVVDEETIKNPQFPKKHVVRKNETLYSIAKSYGTSVNELMKANNH